MFTREYDENDPLNPSKGVALGCALSLPIWAVLVLMIRCADSLSRIPMRFVGLWFEIHGYSVPGL